MRKGLLSKPAGWVDTMGERMGRLLPKNMKASPSPPASQNSWQESDSRYTPPEASEPIQIKESSQESRFGSRRFKEMDTSGIEEPDTSSLGAFLYNLLSCTQKRAQGGDEKGLGGGDYAMAPVPVGSFIENEHDVLQSPRIQKVTDEEEIDEEEAKNAKGDFYDSDWLLVDEHVKAIIRPQPEQEHEQDHEPEAAPCSPAPFRQPLRSPFLRLPSMSDTSSLLTEDIRSFLHPALPTLAKGRQWVLLYSTEKHGISLLTLYRNSNLMSGPCLLVAGDREGAIFGGLMTAPLLPTPKKKYQGTSESFVFTNVGGEPAVFHSTGMNRYFVLATKDALAFGGGSHFALHVDAELLNGSSGTCETYGSSCLAHSEEFILKNVELWGFEHASNYNHHYTPFKDL